MASVVEPGIPEDKDSILVLEFDELPYVSKRPA